MHLILKKTTSIIIILSLVISLVSCSKTIKKKYNYIEDYRDVVYSFANNFGYEITDEKNLLIILKLYLFPKIQFFYNLI